VIDEKPEYSTQADMALYHENLYLSAVCQFYGVLVFVELMHDFVDKRASKETRDIIRFAGFQGVHAWILVGVVNTVFHWGLHVAKYSPAVPSSFSPFVEAHKDPIAKVDLMLNHVFSAMTLLCIYNMILICRFKDIQDALAHPSLKFFGTRFLLLVAQVQPQILRNQVVRNLAIFRSYDGHTYSEKTPELAHVALLPLECLLVIAFNYVTWEFGADKELIFDARDEEVIVEEKKSQLAMSAQFGPSQVPLLDADSERLDGTCNIG
jgi:hypothetical protein